MPLKIVRTNSFIRKVRYSQALSLTPTLSRWERECCRPSFAIPGALDHSNTRPNWLPLPAGEGWGEGEQPQTRGGWANLPDYSRVLPNPLLPLGEGGTFARRSLRRETPMARPGCKVIPLRKMFGEFNRNYGAGDAKSRVLSS